MVFLSLSLCLSLFLFVSRSLPFSLACSRLLTHNVSPVRFSRLILLRVNDDEIVNTRVLCTSFGPASCVLRGGGLTMSQRAHPGPSEANSILSPYCPTTAVSTKDKIGLARSACGEGGGEQDSACQQSRDSAHARNTLASKDRKGGGSIQMPKVGIMKVRRWMVLGTLLAPPMHPTSSCLCARVLSVCEKELLFFCL